MSLSPKHCQYVVAKVVNPLLRVFRVKFSTSICGPEHRVESHTLALIIRDRESHMGGHDCVLLEQGHTFGVLILMRLLELK